MGLNNKFSGICSNRPKEHPIRTDGVGIMPILSSSDSEEDDISFGTYTALPQEAADISNFEIDDCDEDEDDTEEDDAEKEGDSNDSQRNNKDAQGDREKGLKFGFDEATKSEVTELWNSTNNSTDIIMDCTKVEQIKNAMAGFNLPSTAIPSWAKKIPEEEWKQQIINKVNLLNNAPKNQ